MSGLTLLIENMHDKHFSINSIDEKDQRKMDITSVQTLNGHKDGEVILKCLAAADGKKLARFRIVHQCIKLWAKRTLKFRRNVIVNNVY